MNTQENVAQPVENKSLTTFGAAIGGAVLGMLLTLLVLAVINSGTLSFSDQGLARKVDLLDAKLSAVDSNVENLDYNVTIGFSNTATLIRRIAELEFQVESLTDK